MLERRLDNQTRGDSSVRREVARILRAPGTKPAPIHRALMRLADRGGAVTIVTTNFDLLLEDAGKRPRFRVETYSLGSIPRPIRHTDFSGVLHIHGALDRNPGRVSELVISDQDFGEFYLRRRVVPDFIYDAARLFHLVLVGYSANDPPMRYLLNAVAADGTRFTDLKERFTFLARANLTWRPLRIGEPGGLPQYSTTLLIIMRCCGKRLSDGASCLRSMVAPERSMLKSVGLQKPREIPHQSRIEIFLTTCSGAATLVNALDCPHWHLMRKPIWVG